MAERFHGIIPALLTPFSERGELDAAALERLIEHQIAGGVHGVFVAGMTGEGASLTKAQLQTLAMETKRILADRLPYCVGVLHGSTDRVIELANELRDADFLSALPPYAMPGATQEQILRHFDVITTQTHAKWMIYGNAGCYPNIAPETFRALGQLPSVVAIKDTRSDFEGHLKNLMATADVDVTLLCGGEYLVGPGLLMGARGNISGATNLYPKLFVALYNAAMARDAAQTTLLSKQVARLHGGAMQSGAHWLAAFKHMSSRLGLTQPYCLSPLPAVTVEQARALDALMEEFEQWR